MIGFILYGVLGVALGLVGVNVVDNPLGFIAIMALAVGIDVNSKFNRG